jgi:molybdopterin converting factor small subunit
MITFELFPGVSDAIKKQRFEINFPGGSLGEAINKLLEAYPHLEGDILLPGKMIQNTLAVFVNDERISGEKRESFEIGDGDRITILTPLSGG